MQQMMKRHEVPLELTWKIEDLFKTEEDFQKSSEEVFLLAQQFENDYKGQLTQADTLLKAIQEYEQILLKKSHIDEYAFLDFSVDMSDANRASRAGKTEILDSKINTILSFFHSELIHAPQELLEEALEKTPIYKTFLKDILREKPHALSPETEKALTALFNTTESFHGIYSQALHADLNYAPLTLEGKEIPMSFVKFENEYQIHPDTKLRRESFEAFSKELRKYENTVAAIYNAQVQKEKTMATLCGFDSVFDYLLFQQKVDPSMYHRQIDIIMKELAPIMRKYAKLIQKTYGLEEMTFADLKAPLDPEYAPKITIEGAQQYVEGALSVMGEEYMSYVRPYFKDRWVDYAQNAGKTSGGFCASPYRIHPFILLSWTGELSEVFTLVHELGHGAHFGLAQQEQSFFNQDISMYLVEAPSTCNEMLLSNYLMKQKDDPRFRRWVLASMIENTYYHNFVTHLLEAHFQRKVYELVDKGEVLGAETLNQLKRETLEEFWGDAVKINDGAELTWMRQSHYYMGLYSYTYSAGLTLSTVISQAILYEGQPAVDRWISFLKAGGTKEILDMAKLAGIDISTDKPLKETIAFIGSLVDQVIQLSQKL